MHECVSNMHTEVEMYRWTIVNLVTKRQIPVATGTMRIGHSKDNNEVNTPSWEYKTSHVRFWNVDSHGWAIESWLLAWWLLLTRWNSWVDRFLSRVRNHTIFFLFQCLLFVIIWNKKIVEFLQLNLAALFNSKPEGYRCEVDHLPVRVCLARP